MVHSDGPVGPFPQGSEPEEYDRLRRRVMWSMPSGLYLLGTSDGERRNLMTCNLVSQLSFDPKLVGVSVERGALSYELIEASQAFALSILRKSDRGVVRKFVKPAVDDGEARTLNGFAYQFVMTGSPIYAGAFAYLDCRLYEARELGSHSLFIGEVVGAGFLIDEDDEVLEMSDTRMSYGG